MLSLSRRRGSLDWSPLLPLQQIAAAALTPAAATAGALAAAARRSTTLSSSHSLAASHATTHLRAYHGYRSGSRSGTSLFQSPSLLSRPGRLSAVRRRGPAPAQEEEEAAPSQVQQSVAPMSAEQKRALIDAEHKREQEADELPLLQRAEAEAMQRHQQPPEEEEVSQAAEKASEQVQADAEEPSLASELESPPTSNDAASTPASSSSSTAPHAPTPTPPRSRQKSSAPRSSSSSSSSSHSSARPPSPSSDWHAQRALRKAERSFLERMSASTHSACSVTPLHMLPEPPLALQVVMAPGDSRPRKRGRGVQERLAADTTSSSDVAPASSASSDLSALRTSLLTSLDSAPYPTLSPIARLAPGLDESIHVRGVLRIGEELSVEEKMREEESPMIRTKEWELKKQKGLLGGTRAAITTGIPTYTQTSAATHGTSADSSTSTTSASSTAASSSSSPSEVPPASSSSSSSPSLPNWSSGFATPYEHIVHPHLVDLSPLPGHEFITSSRDQLLLRLAREHECQVMGSTSSTTRFLSHLIYSMGNFHPVRSEGILQADFEALPLRPTSAERSPAVVMLRKRRELEEKVKDVESEEHERRVKEELSLRHTSSSSPSSPSSSDDRSLFDLLPSVWAMDSGPGWSNPPNRILMELGHTLEAAFTHHPDTFAKEFIPEEGMGKEGNKEKGQTVQQQLQQPQQETTQTQTTEVPPVDSAVASPPSAPTSSSSSSPAPSSDPTSSPSPPPKPDVRDAYLFVKMGEIMFRSQLDCWDPALQDRKELQSFVAKQAQDGELEDSSSSSLVPPVPTLPSWPGWEKGGLVFDLKTRATLPIRLFCRRYSDLLDYHLLYTRGLLYSFEREYYDMQRAAFLKYSLQCRIGRMGGVLVGYHNTVRTYGFHFLPLKEMDEALFGHTLIAEWFFQQSMKLMNRHLTAPYLDEQQGILAICEEIHRRNWVRRNKLVQIKKKAEEEEEQKKMEKQKAGVSEEEAAKAELSKQLEMMRSEELTIEEHLAQHPEGQQVVPPSDANSSKTKSDSPPLTADDPLTPEEESALFSSPPPPLRTLKLTLGSSYHSPEYVTVFAEMLPPEVDGEPFPGETLDPQSHLPFLQRATTQRRVDAMPNYKIREYLRELGLDARGSRVAIVSRLEGALSIKPQESLPPLQVYKELAQMNLLHKFVIRIQLGQKGTSQSASSTSATELVDSSSVSSSSSSSPAAAPSGRDPAGNLIVDPYDVGTLIEQWVAEYKRRDEAAEKERNKIKKEARRKRREQQQQLEEEEDEDEGEDEEVVERSAGARGAPLSSASLRLSPSSFLSVSSSLTHFSVGNGLVSADDLAMEYRRALFLNLNQDKPDEEEQGDMAEVLRMSMQSLVQARSRAIRLHKNLARERRMQKRKAIKDRMNELERMQSKEGILPEEEASIEAEKEELAKYRLRAEQEDEEEEEEERAAGRVSSPSLSSTSSPSSSSSSSYQSLSDLTASYSVSDARSDAWAVLRGLTQTALNIKPLQPDAPNSAAAADGGMGRSRAQEKSKIAAAIRQKQPALSKQPRSRVKSRGKTAV